MLKEKVDVLTKNLEEVKKATVVIKDEPGLPSQKEAPSKLD